MKRGEFFDKARMALREAEREGHMVADFTTSSPAFDVIRSEADALTHMQVNPPPLWDTLLGFPVVIDPTMPNDEAVFKNQRGEVVGKIVGLSLEK